MGDYRGWIQGATGTRPLPQHIDAEQWVQEYELWRPDLRDFDLGLVEDKIERVFRETYNQYLLTDAGSARLVLTLPSFMPHPLLSSLLSTLFGRWRFPTITLLSSATMSATAAGLRSALVVDLGWAETTATAIYEYREVTTKRTTRAMKSLVQEMGRLLTRLASGSEEQQTLEDKIAVGFTYCEEVTCRFAWCKPHSDNGESTEEAERKLSIPSPVNPEHEYCDVSLSSLAGPVENVLLASDVEESEMDDHEKSIPLLLYNTLLVLPPDVRGTCMSRIVFVGGGARIPGLRQRILRELTALIDRHGWSPVRGGALDRQRERLEQMKISKEQTQANAAPTINGDKSEALEEPEVDFVEQKLRRQNKDTPVPVQGVVREIESLGAWAGASLVTSLQIRGMVEIEREKFLQHGLAGATRDSEPPVPDRRSGLRAGDRSSWTLAGWA